MPAPSHAMQNRRVRVRPAMGCRGCCQCMAGALRSGWPCGGASGSSAAACATSAAIAASAPAAVAAAAREAHQASHQAGNSGECAAHMSRVPLEGNLLHYGATHVCSRMLQALAAGKTARRHPIPESKYAGYGGCSACPCRCGGCLVTPAQTSWCRCSMRQVRARAAAAS